MCGEAGKKSIVYFQSCIFPHFLISFRPFNAKLRLSKYVPIHLTTKTKPLALTFIINKKKRKKIGLEALSNSKKILMIK